MQEKQPGPEQMEMLKAALLQDQERKRHEKDRAVAVLKAGTLPTPPDIVAIINWRVGESRQSILRHHVYWKEYKLRQGLKALLDSVQAAHLDLCRLEAALTAYARRREPFHKHIEHTVTNPAQKEVMAFCSAYHGTIDTLRRFKNTRPDLHERIQEMAKKSTSTGEFAFIKDLRTNLSHGSVVVPYWSIVTNGEGSSGHISLDTYDVLSFGSWKAKAKGFIQSAPGGRLRISEITDKCTTALGTFYDDLTALFFEHRTPAEEDFFNIRDAYKRLGSRQSLKLFLGTFSRRNGDPYRHLHRYFKPSEVREILRRPKHSAEQVDYIIGLRSVDTDCDDELRHLLYRLFGVTKNGDSSDGAET